MQIISLAIGISVSFFVGRQSAQKAAKDIIKPHPRAAFRRLVSLYQSLQRAATTLESAQDSEADHDYRVTLAKLEVIVALQLMTADDALADWNDIVPEDVAELKRILQSDNKTRD